MTYLVLSPRATLRTGLCLLALFALAAAGSTRDQVFLSAELATALDSPALAIGAVTAGVPLPTLRLTQPKADNPEAEPPDCPPPAGRQVSLRLSNQPLGCERHQGGLFGSQLSAPGRLLRRGLVGALDRKRNRRPVGTPHARI